MTEPPPIQPARPSLPPAESWLAGVPTPAQQRQDRYAVAAFVTSLPGLVPVAVVLAGIALRRIKRTGSRGKRLAYGALAISVCWMIAIGVAVALGLYGERRAGIGRTVGDLGGRRTAVFRRRSGGGDAAGGADRRLCGRAHRRGVREGPASLAGLSAEDKGTVATQQCATAFGAFVGKPYEQSELDMYYVVLEDRAVADGNVLCLVGMPGTQLTGTMRGSQR